MTGDRSLKEDAIRRLNWATYTVDTDGKNRYIRDDNWLTDGYGDYVRHYLRAMASAPELAPEDQNHLLRTNSVVQSIQYGNDSIKGGTHNAGAARGVAVAGDGTVYVGLRDHVEVYDAKGRRVNAWDGPGNKAWLTGLALGENDLFAADSGNRMILRYDRSGKLVGPYW
jgi:hypothetical protein